MRDKYDFDNAQPATAVEHLNRLRAEQTRLTLAIDANLLEAVRQRADQEGIGYQMLIETALRQYLVGVPVDEVTLRRVLREELQKV